MNICESAAVGIIMLDTHFPRFIGDIGNKDTWPFDVIYEVVSGSLARSVVKQTDRQNLSPYIEAGLSLQQRGASAITTSCGFLALHQEKIAVRLKVPFVASSLIQVPWIQSLLPAGQHVGILTIDSSSLTTAHLQAAGINREVLTGGTENGRVFTQAILSDAIRMNRQDCEQDNINAALELTRRQPDIGAIVLECTNMAPYANAIHKATKLPVYSIYTLIRWLHSGLSPASFG